ncbi:MAG: hypothetical protein K2X38_08725 [Gemmataceae bacterium]|nr:hypothetical protein [Gemmataceae bacterium]
MLSAVLMLSLVAVGDPLPLVRDPLPLAAARPVAPPVPLAPAPLAPRQTVRPTAGPQHSHRCPRCGNEWWHTESSFGNRNDHTCPACGYGPVWTVNRRGGGPSFVAPRIEPYQPRQRTLAPSSARDRPT